MPHGATTGRRLRPGTGLTSTVVTAELPFVTTGSVGNTVATHDIKATMVLPGGAMAEEEGFSARGWAGGRRTVQWRVWSQQWQPPFSCGRSTIARTTVPFYRASTSVPTGAAWRRLRRSWLWEPLRHEGLPLAIRLRGETWVPSRA